MGRKSSLKKIRKSEPINVMAPSPKPMDPLLVKAFARGRESGIKEGKVDGIAEIMTKFDQWIDEIDTRVKGIGPKTKMDLQIYFAERIKESIDKNRKDDIS